MFPFPIATPQGCNIQTFYGTGPEAAPSGFKTLMAWNKPVGVSHVYMLLIGGGGSGDGTAGGGSGAVTVWYGAAQHVPNYLLLQVACISAQSYGMDTIVRYKSRLATPVDLLTATSASGSTAGAATNINQFAVSGFYQSIAGQDGTGGNSPVSTTTFLSGGSAAQSNTVTANYGYALSAATTNLNGTFLMQPIIVGLGGKAGGRGGIGCGGGRDTGIGGPGMVLIASW